MNGVNIKDLYKWCTIPANQLVNHPDRKIPFRLVTNSVEMGQVMAKDFVNEIKSANADGRAIRAIVPCGPKCWYAPFTQIVNEEKVSLRNMTVFHMDECLNWEGKPLPENHPYNFRTFMEKYFYGDILQELSVPQENRYFPLPSIIETIRHKIAEAPVDITLGGWGQDGHIAYNQTRRHPLSKITIEQLKKL